MMEIRDCSFIYVKRFDAGSWRSLDDFKDVFCIAHRQQAYF